MIYIAQPYSSSDPTLVEARYQYALAAIAYVLENHQTEGTPYSPIAHFHEMAKKFSLPTDASFWLAHNFSVLSHCDKMAVLQLPGYEQSTGLTAELAFARVNGIPVFVIDQQQLDSYINTESTLL